MKKIFILITITTAALIAFLGCTGEETTSEIANSETSSTQMAINELTYDKASAGDLYIPFVKDGKTINFVRFNDSYLNIYSFSYDEDLSCLVINEDTMLSFEEGRYDLSIITDQGASYLSLNIENFIYSNLVYSKDIYYRVGQGDLELSGDFSQASVKAIYVNDISVPSEFYQETDEDLLISEDVLNFIYTQSEIKVVLDNNKYYRFTLHNNNVFASDYDMTTIWKDFDSDLGGHPLVQDTNMISYVQDEIKGRSIMYTPANGSRRLGDWQVLAYTFKDPSSFGMALAWYSIDLNNSSNAYYEIAFDYKMQNISEGDSYSFIIMSDAAAGFYMQPKSAGLTFNLTNSETVQHFSLKISGDLFEGSFIYASQYADDSSLVIDNYRITKLDSDISKSEVLETSKSYTANSSQDINYSADIKPGTLLEKAVVNVGTSGHFINLPADKIIVTNNLITISADFADKLYGNSKIYLFFSTGETKVLSLESNILFYTNYDDVLIYDNTVSNYGLNEIAQDSATISVVAGISGNSLKYSPGQSLYLLGPWQNRVLTIQDPDHYSFTWLRVDFSETEQYQLSFKYLLENVTDEIFKIVILTADGPVYANPDGSGTVYQLLGNNNEVIDFSLTVSGNQIYGLYIYIEDSYTGNASLLIDDFKIVEVN